MATARYWQAFLRWYNRDPDRRNTDAQEKAFAAGYNAGRREAMRS